jgi:hypothetical protein
MVHFPLNHFPINHRLRRIYRTLAGLAGLYVLIFGIVGVIRADGSGLFGRGHIVALGLRTNMAFSILSIVVGALVIGATLYGRNLAHFVHFFGGLVFLLAGLAMLAVLRTSANFLNFTVATCVVSYIIGLVMLTAGLYGRMAPRHGAPPHGQLDRGEVSGSMPLAGNQ